MICVSHYRCAINSHSCNKLWFRTGLRFIGRIAALARCGLLLQTEKRGLSVGLSVCHDREPCKTAEPIVMPFGMLTRVGYHVGSSSCMRRAISRVKSGRPEHAGTRPAVDKRDSAGGRTGTVRMLIVLYWTGCTSAQLGKYD